METWKYIDGYVGYYMVSTYGRVKALGRVDRMGRFHKPRILKHDHCHGHYRVTLCKDGKTKRIFIHHLVANAFLTNPLNRKIINHKNGIPSDNHPDNLEWSTYQENNRHAFETGLNKGTRGSTNGMSKLVEADVLEIKYYLNDGYKDTELASMYDVSRETIRDIRLGKRWKHVKSY